MNVTRTVGRRGFDIAMVGSLLAMVGTYWDDAWHTDRGRDTFLAPPHVVLYAGAGILAVVLVWSLVSAAVAAGVGAVRRRPGSRLAVVGVSAIFLAAPVDDAWHQILGRDAVLWSPPHLLGLTGSLAAAVGLADLARPLDSWRSSMLGSVIVATTMMAVLEYETDVPQFADAWYLPAVILAWGIAATLIVQRDPRPWALTTAAAVYTVVRVAVAVGLDQADHSSALVPPILAVAVVADVTRRRSVLAAAVAVPLLIVVTYPLIHDASPLGLDLSGGEVGFALIGIPLLLLVHRVVQVDRKPRRCDVPLCSMFFALLVLGLALSGAQPAGAHDPGQGPKRATVAFDLVTDDGPAGTTEITITAQVALNDCSDLAARRSVARRGGRTATGSLRPDGACRWVGEVTVDESGRWFVYMELDRGAMTLESWFPISTQSDSASGSRALYLPPPDDTGRGLRAGAGSALALVNLVLLVTTLRSGGGRRRAV